MKTCFNIRSLGGIARSLAVWALCIAVVACEREHTFDEGALSADSVVFSAGVGSHDGLTTRANNAIYDVTAEYYGNCDFFMTVAGQSESGAYNRASSIYEIPSGSAAVIVPKKSTGEKSLKWYSRTREHNFWGWAAHRDLIGHGLQELPSGDYKVEFRGSTLNDMADSKAQNWKPDEDVWRNGELLEPLISAKAGPFIYNDDGMYVPLRFRHLVSKVFLKEFYIIDNATGSTDTNVRGTITFYGMPTEATLYTNPTNAAGEPVEPYVAMPDDWDYDPLQSVTYALTNYSNRSYKWEGYSDSGSSMTARDCWYICPEVDFGSITFKIELYEYSASTGEWIPSTAHGKHGAFFGDFSDVVFERKAGSDYDKPEGGDRKILHAGEYLTLTIHISKKGNPAVWTTVSSWSTGSSSGSSHVEQGIYSLEDLKYMSSLMYSGSDEDKETFYELYGSMRDTTSDDKSQYPQYKDKDGNDTEYKILELYDDIGSFEYVDNYTSSRINKTENLYVADGYMLDGRGHTVNFVCVGSYSKPVGNVRDIYLRGYYHQSSSTIYVEHIVYIDKMGQVWKVDPVTYEMTATQYNMNDYPKNPVTIDFATGRIS